MPDDLNLDADPSDRPADEQAESTLDADAEAGTSVLDEESHEPQSASAAGILGDSPAGDDDAEESAVGGDDPNDSTAATDEPASESNDETTDVGDDDPPADEPDAPSDNAADAPFAFQAAGAPRRTPGRPAPAASTARHVPGEPISQAWDSVQRGLKLVGRGTWLAILAGLAWLAYLAADDDWILERIPQAAPYATAEARLGLVIAAGCLLGLATVLALVGTGHCCSVPRRHARVAAFRAMTFLCGTVVEVGGVVAIAVFFDSPMLLLFTYVCTLAAGLIAAFFFLVFERRVAHYFHANGWAKFLALLILAVVILCGAAGYWLLQPPPEIIPAEYLRWAPYAGPVATILLLLLFRAATGGVRRAIRAAAASAKSAAAD